MAGMKNYDVLKQMPVRSFANMVFHIVKDECESLEDFENFLNKEIKPEFEALTKETLKEVTGIEKVDGLINELCSYISGRIKANDAESAKDVAVNTKALAELLSARALLS